jgi:uncharacterized protein YoxC
MIIEIIVGAIGASFVVLVIFLIMTLYRLRKVMKKTDRVLTEAHHLLHTLSEPSVELIHNTNKLVVDVKKKSEGLDVIFRPLYDLKKERSEGSKGFEKICDLLECAIEGARLFIKIKNERKS